MFLVALGIWLSIHVAIFAIIIYIPQYDKNVNHEFIFMNVGFFIAAIVKKSPYINLEEVYSKMAPEPCRKRGIQNDTKRIA